MKKNLFLTAVCSCFALLAKAEPTDISGIENVVYAESMSCSAGSSFTMSVKMKNNIEVTGFQFDLELPSGITIEQDADDFYLIALSEQRTTSAKTNYFDSAKQPDGSVRVMASSTKNYTFSGNDGEVATISINVADDVEDGKYPIVFKNIVLSDAAANSYETERVEVELTVGAEAYDEGYSISIAPFSANAGTAYTIALNFDAKDENITDIEFDFELPSFLSRTKSGRVTKAFESADDNRMYVSGTEGDHTITVDGNHVTIASIVTDEYKYIAGTNGALVNMYYTSSANVEEGLYPVRLTNVTMVNGEGEILSVAPTTSFIKVGNPTGATLAVEGYVSADFNETLTLEPSLGTLDMSRVVSMKGLLTLVDGRNFIGSKTGFNAENVYYSRSLSYEYGTICLPFALESDATVQYYKLAAVSADKMTFEPVADVEAGEPAVFKSLSGNELTINAADVTVTEGSKEKVHDVSGWTMKGTYSSFDNNPSDCENSIYYIAEDKFWYANVTFPVATFRGWFETQSAVGAKPHAFTIVDSEENATGIEYIEKADGTVDVIFDLSGKRLFEQQNGINIINNHKILKK